MKATLWLCSLVTTMLMLTQSIYATPLIRYQYAYVPQKSSLYQVGNTKVTRFMGFLLLDKLLTLSLSHFFSLSFVRRL